MTTENRFWAWARSMAAGVGAALILGGCGNAPLAPTAASGGASGTPSSPPVLVVQPDGSVSFVPASIAGALPSGSLTSSGRSLSTSQDVDGAAGGVVACGRFLLHVPAGAFDGKGTVTMRMRDSTVMVVDLEISPSDLNGFKEPISLAVNTTGADVAVDTLNMYWYDPEKSHWTWLQCDKDLSTEPALIQRVEELEGAVLGTGGGTTRGLWTPLSHFSTYSAGKAGW